MTTPDQLTGTLELPDGRTLEVYFSAYANYVIEQECGESALTICQSLVARQEGGRAILSGMYRPIIAALMGGLEGARQKAGRDAKTARDKAAVRREPWTIGDAAELVDIAGIEAVVKACFPPLAASFPKSEPGDEPDDEETDAPLAESGAGSEPETPQSTPE